MSGPLVVSDHANHCYEHGYDRPGGDASDKDEKRKLGDKMPGRFCRQEFTAQFVEARQLRTRLPGGRTQLCFGCWTKIVIRRQKPSARGAGIIAATRVLVVIDLRY
jgi:hypothetical protein